jgi:hypothetical protein
MARIPAKRNGRSSLAQNAQIKTMPAPSKGWNARDPLPAMKPEYAITLDNMVPANGGVSLRRGYSVHATGLGTYIETLMEYAPPSGLNKLFAATPSAIYDVSASGAVGAAAVSSLSNGRWQHVNFGATAGNHLCLVNGADGLRTYDGTSWTDRSASVTGATASTFSNIAVHASRLWFTQSGTLDAWYFDVAAVQGAATKLPLGPLCNLGGELVAIGSWTHDGGEGPDDYAVFVTSRGQVVVYQGTDPSSATTWTKVGVFRIGEPIGKRCLVKVGGDLGIITSQGVALLSALADVNVSGQGKLAITNTIANAFAQAYAICGSSFGWQVTDYPAGKLLIVNVPIAERVTTHQYVMDLDTGGWCRFKDINAGCWSLMGSGLYFGGHNGTVYRYGTEYLDDTNSIGFVVQTAFYDFKTPQMKRFVAARPLVRAPEGYAVSIDLKVDYDTTPPSVTGAPVATEIGAVWDLAEWDVTAWEGESAPVAVWQSIQGIGQVGSIAVAGSLSQEFVLNSVDILAEPGGFF